MKATQWGAMWRTRALKAESRLDRLDEEVARLTVAGRESHDAHRNALLEIAKLGIKNADMERAARHLLALKDGPRDDAYRAAKEPAWQALRDALGPE